MIGVVVFAGVWVWRESENWFPAIKTNNCVGKKTFVVEAGSAVKEVADNLAEDGLIDNSFFFQQSLRLSGAETRLQAGTFELECGKSYETIIRVLTTPIGAEVINFQVIEGLRLTEIAESLGAQGLVSPTLFLSKTLDPAGARPYIEDSEILAGAGIPKEHGLEGFLFPDTYDARKNEFGENSNEIIERMILGFEGRLKNDIESTDLNADIASHQIIEWPSGDFRDATLYDVITLASIVQREAALEEEMPDIAQLYWNRLAGKFGDAPPFLNADPTIQYAIGEPGDWWPQLLLPDLEYPSPYNTYTNVGLPPGPISNPGLAAIRATIFPSGSDYLYFVAKCDGSGGHYFATTLEEQTANQALCPQ